jgi:hypothetical protein
VRRNRALVVEIVRQDVEQFVVNQLGRLLSFTTPRSDTAAGHVGSWVGTASSVDGMRSGAECLRRNRKNSHQQPLSGSLGKTGRAKAGVNIPLSQ